ACTRVPCIPCVHPHVCLYPLRRPPPSAPFPYTTLFRSARVRAANPEAEIHLGGENPAIIDLAETVGDRMLTVVVAVVSVALLLRSEEHTSELQSRENLVCRLLLEKKNKKKYTNRLVKHT